MPASRGKFQGFFFPLSLSLSDRNPKRQHSLDPRQSFSLFEFPPKISIPSPERNLSVPAGRRMTPSLPRCRGDPDPPSLVFPRILACGMMRDSTNPSLILRADKKRPEASAETATGPFPEPFPLEAPGLGMGSAQGVAAPRKAAWSWDRLPSQRDQSVPANTGRKVGSTPGRTRTFTFPLSE